MNTAKKIEKEVPGLTASLGEIAEVTQEKAGDILKVAGGYGRKAAKQAQKIIQRHPVEATVAGLVVGLGIGALFFRSR